MCEYCGCQQNDVIAELTVEHDRLRELGHDLAAAAKAADLPMAGRLAAQMQTVLGPHTEVEEAALFPALDKDFGDHLAVLVAEHRAIDAALSELSAGKPEHGWQQRTKLVLEDCSITSSRNRTVSSLPRWRRSPAPIGTPSLRLEPTHTTQQAHGRQRST